MRVRLGRGVADDRRAGRQRGGHQRVLGTHHGRLIHEEVARLQAAVVRAQADVAGVLDDGAERAEGVEVRVEAAAPDHVAAGRRQQRLAEAREQRPGDEEGGADLLRQVRVDRGLGHRIGLQRHRVPVAPLDLHAEVLEQRNQRLGVADVRHVVQDDLLVGQQAGSQQRQRRVLVAGGHDGA
jgi:putative component of toxin-antitoxin plasmid stabilization module